MLLERIRDDPGGSLNACERRVNDGSRSSFTEQFLPRIGNPFTCENFFVSRFDCDPKNVTIFGELPQFCVETCGNESIYVHPDLEDNYPHLHIKQINQEVIPTSSSRTVKLTLRPYYLKLCYPDRIGRVTRELDERHIYSSLEVTERFDRIAKNPDASNIFAFMPERGGMLYTGDDGTKIGLVVRHQTPVGKNANTVRYMIPGFSLFSTDRDCPEDELLLLQLLDENSHISSDMDYLLKQFCYPLIDVFFDCVMLEGIVPEMHSQNVLFGFDDDWNVKSIIIRDLESHDKDITLMHRLGKTEKLDSCPFKCIDVSQPNYAIKHSFMFDHKLGEYLIAELITVASKGNKQLSEQLCSTVKQYVLQKYGAFIKDVDFFPIDGKWYKFENVVVDRTLPDRPYDIKDNPLFR